MNDSSQGMQQALPHEVFSFFSQHRLIAGRQARQAADFIMTVMMIMTTEATLNTCEHGCRC
jgi:hypothetical protein